MMNSFIRLHMITDHELISENNVKEIFIINTDTIDVVGTDGDITILTQKDGTKLPIQESVDHIWEMLKPSIIFA